MADPIPDGEHLTPSSRPWPNDDTGPWLLTFHWQAIAGRAECVGLDIASALPPELAKERVVNFDLPAIGQPVTTSTLRQLRLSEIVNEERERICDHLASTLGEHLVPRVRPVAMRPGTERRLRKAAAVYVAAWRKGNAPVRAVAEAMNVTPAAATKLVSRARAAGFLPPASPGVPTG